MRYGVELEGGFIGQCPTPNGQGNSRWCDGCSPSECLIPCINNQNSCGCQYKEDSSVELSYDDFDWVGECVSPILSSRKAVYRFIETHAPEGVNSTCGLHLHLSWPGQGPTTNISNGFYWGLIADNAHQVELQMITDLYNTGRKLQTAGQIGAGFYNRLLQRLKGDCSYCEPGRHQNGFTTDTRYTALNMYAWHCHRTIEIRVLPGGSQRSTYPMIELAKTALDSIEKSAQRLAQRERRQGYTGHTRRIDDLPTSTKSVPQVQSTESWYDCLLNLEIDSNEDDLALIRPQTELTRNLRTPILDDDTWIDTHSDPTTQPLLPTLQRFEGLGGY